MEAWSFNTFGISLTFWVLLASQEFQFSAAASCPPTVTMYDACTATIDYASQNYTLIPAGYGCAQYGVAGVESMDECHNYARKQLWHEPYELLTPAEAGGPYSTSGTGQPRLSTAPLSFDTGFTGCVLIPGGGIFYWTWVATQTEEPGSLSRRIICRGIATSTTTTTMTQTTETVTETSATQTSSTTETQTVTSSFTATQTESMTTSISETETMTHTATTTATFTSVTTMTGTNTSTSFTTSTSTTSTSFTSSITATETTETQTQTSTILRYQLRDAYAKLYTYGVGTATDQVPEYMEIFVDRAGGQTTDLNGADQIIITSSLPITAAPGSLTVHRDTLPSMATAQVVAASSGPGQVIKLSLTAPLVQLNSATFKLTSVPSDGDQAFLTQSAGTVNYVVTTVDEDVPVTSTQLIRDYTIFSATIALKTQGQETERDTAPEEMELQINRQDGAPFPINGPGAIIVRTTLAYVTNGTLIVQGTDVPGATCEVLLEDTGHVVFNITLAQQVDPFSSVWMLLQSGGGVDDAQFLPVPTAGTATFEVTTSKEPGIFYATIDVPLPPSAASDPITFYNGRKIKFWLPIGELVPLLETPDLHLLASVMQGPEQDQQWFDHFVMTLPNGTAFADIQVTKRFGQNRSSFAARRGSRMSQLDIRLGNEEGQLEPVDLAAGSFFAAGENIRIGIGERAFHPPRVHGLPVMQYLHVEAPSAAFIIMASHAGNEFPHDYELQAKYAHLDWICLDLVNVASFSGILPELWGVQPQSEQVAAMTVPPSMAQCGAGLVCNTQKNRISSALQ